MGIPGEDLPGSWAATEFVAWYNGHPDLSRPVVRPRPARGPSSSETATSPSTSPACLRSPRRRSHPTDTVDPAIEAILGSGIEEIVMLGRRGPAQASFTTPELKELGELADADVIVDPADLELDPASESALAEPAVARNMEVLREYSLRVPSGKRRRLVLRFCTSPVAILGDGRVEAVEVVRNELVADGGSVRAVPTDQTRDHPRRHRPAERRLPRPADSGCSVRSGARDDLEPGGSRPRRRGPARAGRVLHRLDQARAERHHRHEQEGRERDGGAPPRGSRGRRRWRAPVGPLQNRWMRCFSSEAPASLRTAAGRRSTRSSVRAVRSRVDHGSSLRPGTTFSRLRAPAAAPPR